MTKIKSLEESSENFALSTVKASLKIEAHFKNEGLKGSKERALKYARNMLNSSGIRKKRLVELLDQTAARAKELKEMIENEHKDSRL